MTTHRHVNTLGRTEVLRHLATSLDEADVDLLAGVAQSCADQIRALDRLLVPDSADLRSQAERLDYLSALLFLTNKNREQLVRWGTTECAYCGGDAEDPVRVAGRLYCDDTCAMAAAA